VLSGLATFLFALLTFWRSRRLVFGVLTLAALAAMVYFLQDARIAGQKQQRLTEQGNRIYGDRRHETPTGYVLEVGTCEVSIPPDHRVGRLEAPSVVRLEFREDPERHVILQRVTQLEDDAFFQELSQCVGGSAEEQAFVFIHGYNVSFEEAVKRTAQISFDLKFSGAPICYSWPSHGGIAEYTRDEANVAWTVLHLERFLEDVVQRSGARSVHLVAHSMGNRALVQTLERMSLRREGQPPLFGQVIMAAPDVDTGEFRDRYAPAVSKMAHRATLYASSNDQALLASTQVHGYTRAGLSGDHLVVVSDLETIDVSPIDTSLIGHSYYGNNPQMIRDMQVLVELGTPASGRQWLEEVLRPARPAHWVFRTDTLGAP
jgi:esterase/lipase superfamily enzyme